MSDIEPGLENVHIGDSTPPVREGLPPKYRMRADAHYVEDLDSQVFSAPIRQLDVRSIDPIQKENPAAAIPSPDFVESIRRHGVLQPLLVRSRGSRFQILSGSRRLAAALEAGLTEVPCLVERVDDEQARALAAATNIPSTARDVQVRAGRPAADIPLAALADCMTAVASSAGLLSNGSALTQTVAADLVRAETGRALQLLRAAQVLRGEVRLRPRPAIPGAVLQRVMDETDAERRLRGLSLTLVGRRLDGPIVSVDEDLLVASVAALVTAPVVLLETRGVRSVTLGVVTRVEAAVTFVAEHVGAELPAFWRSVLADDGRDVTAPGGPGVAAALVLLRAARHVAELQGGAMAVDCQESSTCLSISLPLNC